MTIQANMALMAAGSYWDVRLGAINAQTGKDTDNDAPIPTGWKVLTQYDVSDSGANASTGFSARVYQSIASGEIVISYGGTEFNTSSIGLAADFLNGNIPLATGNASAQALEAAKLYQRVKADTTLSDNITFTGHSLGGGLASIMAVWFDRPAYVFAAAPFQMSADSTQATTLADIFSLNRALPNVRFQLGSTADPALLSYNPTTDFAAREGNVKAYAIKGELLEANLGMFSWIEGSTNPLFTNAAITLSAGDKHSIDLHAAALLSDTFQTEAGKLPTALERLMDKTLYGGDVLGNKQVIITKLIRNEVGVRRDDGTQVLLAANGMLTHFAADLQKLGTNVAGLTKAAQDAIIAQGIEWYYWQGTDYAGQEFFTDNTASPNLLQYTSNNGNADSANNDVNKALQYVSQWLDPIAQASGSYSATYNYDQWNIAAGSGGSTATARNADQTQIFIGGDGADTFTAGDKVDMILTGSGADTLNGGAGGDLLYGGVGNDTYQLTSGELFDVITDSDGNGTLRVDGLQLTGGRQAADDYWISDDRQWGYSLTSGGDLIISNFGLIAAITEGGAGHLGIKLDPTQRVALAQDDGTSVGASSANFWADPDYDANNLQGQSSDMLEGNGAGFHIYLAQGTHAGDTVTLALVSELAAEFQARKRPFKVRTPEQRSCFKKHSDFRNKYAYYGHISHIKISDSPRCTSSLALSLQRATRKAVTQ